VGSERFKIVPPAWEKYWVHVSGVSIKVMLLVNRKAIKSMSMTETAMKMLRAESRASNLKSNR